MRYRSLLILPVLFFILESCDQGSSEQFESYWNEQPDRYWIGPEYWANSLQDWHLNNGRLECINSTQPMRTVHILDRCLTERPGNLHMKVETGLTGERTAPDSGQWTGFLIGAGGPDMDYRGRAIIHRNHGKGGGYIAAVNTLGDILFIDNETGEKLSPEEETAGVVSFEPRQRVILELQLVPSGENYELSLTAANPGENAKKAKARVIIRSPGRIAGNLALIANGGGPGKADSFWYRDWHIKGSKLKVNPEQRYGPVLGVLYTISDNTLTITAQLPPVSHSDAQEVSLEIMDKETGHWKKMAVSQIIIPGYIVRFRLDSWNASQVYDYRIGYPLRNRKGINKPYYYYGVIVRDPADKEEIVIAAFTGNSNSDPMGSGLFDFRNRLWFPHQDITSYVASHNPDLLVYTGDNVYEGRPTPPDLSSEKNTELDYLYKWYLFLWAHGVLTRNIPTVAIPDDHDVYHGNLWGEGGVKAPLRPADSTYPSYYKGLEDHWQQDQGGYKLSPAIVNMIQLTQTGNLPDPYDRTPVEQGIGVYYCSLNYGRISFAILEDRKFKSAPSPLMPGKKIVNGFSLIRGIDGRSLDHPDAELLGERQLKFIEDWAADWEQADMKIALSQTIFADLCTYPDSFIIDAGTPGLLPLPRDVIPGGYSKAKDMDSNGWPQTGRQEALKALRKGFAFMIGGDQHLGSVIHHGTDDWEDAGYSLCVPSIANLWPRRWFPQYPGLDHKEGMPLYTGRYFDGFGNRMTVCAVSNPCISGKEPAALHDRAPGYGIVRLNKKNQLITIECWPRYADPGSFDGLQYPGWPITISMEDNYGRIARAWLPVFTVTGLDRPPVIQVIDEQKNEIVYTLRCRESRYQPKVFGYGTYTVRIGEPGTDRMKTISGIRAGAMDQKGMIPVAF